MEIDVGGFAIAAVVGRRQGLAPKLARDPVFRGVIIGSLAHPFPCGVKRRRGLGSGTDSSELSSFIAPPLIAVVFQSLTS